VRARDVGCLLSHRGAAPLTLPSTYPPGLTEEQVVARLGLPLPLPTTDSLIVWTTGMQRLYTLVALSLKYDEPVLMVGETGCGKTSVCQLISAASRRHLYEVNCHQNMETADLLGGQKPVRNRAAIQGALLADFAGLLDRLELAPASERPAIDTIERALDFAESLVRPGHALPAESVAALRQISGQLKRSTALFEWHDGPLIQAMAGGELILLDEVSLADDSVLERLNSVLEPARTLVVVEKGGKDVSQMTIVGASGFEVLATMNPGGDYGKKELSPALRNRFTEIWVPSLDNHADLLKIVQSSWATELLEPYGERLLAFLRWFAAELGEPSTPVVGVRDILVRDASSCSLALAWRLTCLSSLSIRPGSSSQTSPSTTSA
jgi:midasin